MRVVIDTNVAIAANGRSTHASLACQIKCIEFVEVLTSPKTKKRIVLDSLDLLLDEYKKHLNFRGQPGIGDAFYKYLHDHMYTGTMLEIVEITPNHDVKTGFNELPANSIDKSDRKILATALVAGASIVNAMDNDWHEQREFLKQLGVNVIQICPEHGCVK